MDKMSLATKIQEFIDKNYIYRFDALGVRGKSLREIMAESVGTGLFIDKEKLKARIEQEGSE